MTAEQTERFVAWTYGLACAAFTVVYVVRFGPVIFCWFCCAANILVALGLARRNALLVSMASVSVLPVQFAYALDGAARFGGHAPLFTELDAAFSASRPAWLRLMTLHHVVAGGAALYGLKRFGYDPRALGRQSAFGTFLLLAGFSLSDPRTQTDDLESPRVSGVAFDPDYDVNWSHGIGGRPDTHAPPYSLLIMLVGYPVAVHLPMHLLLRRTFRREPAR